MIHLRNQIMSKFHLIVYTLDFTKCLIRFYRVLQVYFKHKKSNYIVPVSKTVSKNDTLTQFSVNDGQSSNVKRLCLLQCSTAVRETPENWKGVGTEATEVLESMQKNYKNAVQKLISFDTCTWNVYLQASQPGYPLRTPLSVTTPDRKTRQLLYDKFGSS